MDTKLLIQLQPVGTPNCRITLGHHVQEFTLVQKTTVQIDCVTSGVLIIEHLGKLDNDPDTAIIIEQIHFNEITSPKFVYQGIYYPQYPKHLLGGAAELPHKNYLSWNGSWKLEFTLPIYTWMHKTLGLGWIYD